MTNRELDVVLFGATGFTGRLVGEYLARAPSKPRWAIAGRNQAKLDALGFGVPVIVADAMDATALAALARRAKVVCTTAGPYSKYGSELVAACAEHGTHYCDLTGEVPWMRRMIDAHHERARDSGARIVHTCGFDSIPSDLGTWALQQEMLKAFGMPATSVTGLFGPLKGGASGGTVASGIGLAKEAGADRAVRKLLANPHALDPDPDGWHPPDRDSLAIGWETTLRVFTAPFFMAGVNTRVVRRSHALAGRPWGDDFTYREVMSTPGSPRGLAMAAAVTGGLAAMAFALSRPRLRDLAAKRMPQPGEGPSAGARAKGRWKAHFVGEVLEHRLVYVAADDHGDPGYASTAKMLGESALCLAEDALTSEGGVLTPSVAMGHHLLDRLRKAGLTWEVVPRL
jgi:short subunit dehydrogenase-like uncharacterized protein